MSLTNSVPSLLDAHQVTKRVFDGTNDANRIIPLNNLVPYQFDAIVVAYPSSTTETYTFKQGGTSGISAAVITVTYTDNTKASVSTIVRT